MRKVQVLNENIWALKPGDPVWWLDDRGKCREGVMTKEPGAMFKFSFGECGFSSVTLTGLELKSCWPTKQECLDAEEKRRKLQTKAYEDAMGSVGTLVSFLWEHMDKTDKEAAVAVKNRAAVLLGIELKGE